MSGGMLPCMAADPTSVVTAEHLLVMPDDGWRYELVRGELRRMPPAGYRHGRVAALLGRRMGNHAEQHGLGDVLATDTGFTLERGPDTVRAPDAAFVQAARVPEQDRGFAELAPDLVAEVVSPNDTAAEVTEKALMWIAAGVRLVWVVYPDQRVVAVHRPGGSVTILGEDAVLDGEDVLPGFALPLAELFR